MNSHLFLQYGLHDAAVSNFPYAFLWIHQLPEYTQVLSEFCWMHTLTIFRNFTGHSRTTDVFQPLTRVLDGFFEFRILGVDERNPTQFASVFKVKLFLRPLFASPSAWHAFPLTSRVLAKDDLAWM